MKTISKILLLVLFTLAFGTESKGQCYSPHFSSYVNTAIGALTNPPSSAITFTKTTTISGYTQIGNNCPPGWQMSLAQHWGAVSIGFTTIGGTRHTTSVTSGRTCPSCTMNFGGNVTANIDMSNDMPIDETLDSYQLWCTIGGNFSSGTTVFKFIRVMVGSSIPNPLLSKSNCTTGIGTNLTYCTIPIITNCLIGSDAAVNPTDVYALTTPQAKWWKEWDICLRYTPNNSTPWFCPTGQYTIPYGNIGIPIGLPLALDEYTTPPLGDTTCDSKWKP